MIPIICPFIPIIRFLPFSLCFTSLFQDYDDYFDAVENDQFEEFLKIAPTKEVSQATIVVTGVSIERERNGCSNQGKEHQAYLHSFFPTLRQICWGNKEYQMSPYL